MNNIYNKIYNAVNEGIQKALLIDPEQNDVSINYSYHKINNQLDPLLNVIISEFVDLGLPSGTLWCSHNLDATCEDNDVSSWYGNYYAWGELETKYKLQFDKVDYDNYNERINKKYEKYGNFSLLDNDDVIYKNYKLKNSSYSIKMPTYELFDELLKNTATDWEENYNNIAGLNGRTFIGKNGNSIFIPAAGYIKKTLQIYDGNGCCLWTKDIIKNKNNYNEVTYGNRSKAYNLLTFNSIININNLQYRFYGMPVRAVCFKK